MAAVTVNIPLALPHLQPDQKVKDWRISYTAATLLIQEKESIGYLPIVIDRTVSEQKWACEAAKRGSLAEALDELELRLDGKQTRLQAISAFFDLKPATTMSLSNISELFFNTWEIGKVASVANDIIALKFLQHLPVGVKLFSEHVGMIKQGMSDSELIALFDAANERLSRQPSVIAKLDAMVLLEETEPMPEWANSLQMQVTALQERLHSVTVLKGSDLEEEVYVAEEVKPVKEQSSTTCNICGKTNHSENKCFRRICSKCSRKGHSADKCTRRR